MGVIPTPILLSHLEGFWVIISSVKCVCLHVLDAFTLHVIPVYILNASNEWRKF